MRLRASRIWLRVTSSLGMVSICVFQAVKVVAAYELRFKNETHRARASGGWVKSISDCESISSSPVRRGGRENRDADANSTHSEDIHKIKYLGKPTGAAS